MWKWLVCVESIFRILMRKLCVGQSVPVSDRIDEAACMWGQLMPARVHTCTHGDIAVLQVHPVLFWFVMCVLYVYMQFESMFSWYAGSCMYWSRDALIRDFRDFLPSFPSSLVLTQAWSLLKKMQVKNTRVWSMNRTPVTVTGGWNPICEQGLPSRQGPL